MSEQALHICIIAAEPSGDALGAHVIRAIKVQSNVPVTFSGLGGPLMQEEGLESLFDISDLAVMGLAEVLPKLKFILKKIKQTSDFIVNNNPNILLTIDAPDFCFRVQKRIRGKADPAHQPKQIHMVAPTVWAWRPGRAKKISGFLDGLICLFDFEPPYFEKEGLKAVSIGHPVVESGALEADGEAFKNRHGIEGQTLGLFFGSRRGEIKRHADVIAQTAAAFPDAHLIVPTLPHLEPSIRNALLDLPNAVTFTIDPAEKWDAFKACDAALAVSGTVGLELAVCGVPHMICYRMNVLTYQIAKRLIKTPYAHLANIILKDEIVPEFIQDRCQAELMKPVLESLLTNSETKQKQLSALENLAIKIGAGEAQRPSEKAAGFVLSLSS